jgi:hypothetical protein
VSAISRRVSAGNAPVPTIHSRTGVVARLAAVAEQPAPPDRSPGACCYAPAGLPDPVEHVCPDCGAKTLYPCTPKSERLAVGRAYLMGTRLPECRRLAAEIRDLDVRLDESEFCEKCRPGVAAPRLALVVRYADGREQRTEDVTPDDLRLLVELTTGALTHEGERESRSPLKDHLPRLETLLGVEHAGGD